MILTMRINLCIIAALIWIGQLPPCAAAEPENSDAVQSKQQAAVWIDVRTPEEYATGHLEDAHNIPHDQIGKRIAELVPDKTTAIHLYCRSGRRSGLARDTLLKLGYTKVFNEGGYEKLIAERKKAAGK